MSPEELDRFPICYYVCKRTKNYDAIVSGPLDKQAAHAAIEKMEREHPRAWYFLYSEIGFRDSGHIHTAMKIGDKIHDNEVKL